MLLAALGSISTAKAQSTWDGGANDTNLSSAVNWNNNTAPTNAAAWVFGSTNGTQGTTLNNNLSASWTNGGITFNAGSLAYTINGNALTLGGSIVNNSSALQTFGTGFVLSAARTITTTSGGGNLLFNGPISGGFGLSFTGTGTTTLSASNTYTGTTTVTGGNLTLATNGAIGTNALSITSGGTLVNNAGATNTITGTTTISSAAGLTSTLTNAGGVLNLTSYTLGSGASIGTNILAQSSGTINLITPNSGVYMGGNASTNQYNQLLLTGGTVYQTNNNYLNMKGGSTVTNLVSVSGGAILNLNAAFNMGGDSGVLTAANNTVTNNGGTITAKLRVMGLNGINTVGQGSGTWTASQIDVGGYDGSNSAISSVDSLVISGGAFTNTGTTSLGKYSVSNNNSISVTGGSAPFGTITLGSVGGFVTNGSSTLTVSGNTNTITLGGGTLTANGISLAAGSIAAGDTNKIIWNGGTLRAGAATGASFFSGSANTLVMVSNSGGIFDANGFNNTIAANITNNGGVGTLTITNSSASNSTVTLSGTNAAGLTVNQGTGTITMVFSGNETLANSNNYSGTTTVSGGTLQANASGALGTNGLIITGGTLISSGVGVTNTIANISTGTINLKAADNTTAQLILTNGATLTNAYTSTSIYIGGGVNTSPMISSNIVTLESGTTLGLAGYLFLGYTANTIYGTSYNLLTNKGGTVTVGSTLWIGGRLNSNNINQFSQIAGSTTVSAQVVLGDGSSYTNNNVTNSLMITGGTFAATNTGGSQITLMQGAGTNILNQLTVSGTGTAIFSNTITMGASAASGVANLTNQIILGGSGVLEVKALLLNANGVGTGGTNTISFDGGTLRAGSGASNNFISNGVASVTLNAGGGTIDSSNNAITIGASIGGSGALTKAGTGTLTLTNANTYLGGTTVNGGQLSLSNAAAIGTGSLTLSAGTVDLGGFTVTNSFGTMTGGTLQNGTLSNNGGTFTLNNSGSATISAKLAGTDALLKSGVGTITLSGVNTYSGGTTVNGGQLSLSNAAAIGTGSLTLSAGTVDLGGFTVTNSFGTMTGGTLQNGTLSNNGGTFTLNNSGSATISAKLAGTDALLKSGVGTTTLSGANTYSGTTTVNGGTLQLGSASSLPSSTALTVSNTGSLDLAGYGGTVSSLNSTSGGTITNSSVTLSTLTLNGSGSSIYAGIFAGNVAFSQSGTGTTTLSGNNSAMTGGITLTGGTLAVAASGNSNALGGGSSTLTLSGTGAQTLDLGGTAQSLQGIVNVSSNGGTLNLTNGTLNLGSQGGVFSSLNEASNASIVSTSFGINIGAYGTGPTQGAPGTSILSGSNDFGVLANGAGLALQGGSLTINNNYALGTDGVMILGGLNGSATLTTTTGFTNASAKFITTTASGYTGAVTLTNLVVSSGILNFGSARLNTGVLNFNIANNSQVVLTNGISVNYNRGGNGVLSQSGSGTLILGGTSTMTGTTLSGGTLQSLNDQALGNGAITVTGGILDLNNVTQNTAGAVALGGGTLQNGTLSVSNTITTTNATITANLAGSASLTQSGTGTTTLSGANTYSGGTTISGGTLALGNTSALGTGNLSLGGGGSLDSTVADLTITGLSGLTITNNFTFLGSQNLNLGTAATTLTGSDTVTVSSKNLTLGGAISGTGSLTKAGAGTLTLSGANTYTGTTKVSAGTLTLNGSLSNSAITVTNATFTENAGGLIAGTTSLTVSTGGTATLSSSNTYTGATTVSGGTLTLATNGAIGTNALTISSGGTLFNNAGATNTASSFIINTTVGLTSLLSNAGTMNFTATSGNQTLGNTNSGGATNMIINTGTFNITNGSVLGLGNTSSGSYNIFTNAGGTVNLGRVVIANNTGVGTNILAQGSGTMTTGPTNTGYINIGQYSTGGLNKVLLTGGLMNIGYYTTLSGNSLTTNLFSVSGGATLTQSSGIQLGGSANNTVTNAGGFMNTGTLRIYGQGGASIIAQGSGTMTAAGVYIGGVTTNIISTNANNTLQVSGGVFSNTSTTYLGAYATNTSNSFSVTGGSATVAGITLGSTAQYITNGSSTTTVSGNTNTITLGGGTLTASSIGLAAGSIAAGDVNQITFDGGTLAAGASSTSFLSNGVATVSITTNNGTILQNGKAVTIGANLGGAGTLTVGTAAGTGTLTLSGTNSNEGGVLVNGGTLAYSGTYNGGNSGNITVNTSAILAGTGTAGAVTVNSGGKITSGGSAGTTTGTLNVTSLILNSGSTYNWNLLGTSYDLINASGAVTLSSGLTFNIATTNTSFNSATNYTIMTALGGFTGFDGSNFTITGTNANMTGSYAFQTNGNNLILAYTVANNVWASGSGNLSTLGITNGSTLVFSLAGGSVTNNNAVQSLAGIVYSNTVTGSFNFTGTNITLGTNGAGGITNNSTYAQSNALVMTLGADATINATSGNLILSGALTNAGYNITVSGASNTTLSGVVSGTGTLVQNGPGTLTLSGANTYSGGTTLNAGQLSLSNSAALGTGALTVASNATVAALASFQLTNNIALQSGVTGTVDSGANKLTNSGIISGLGALTKAGTGTLTLSGANTFSGGTTLNAGQLSISNNAALGTGALTVASNATVAALASFQLTNNIVLGSGATGSFDMGGNQLTNSGLISGQGALKLTNGTLTLSSSNTYSGGTVLGGGTLNINNNNALGTGVITSTFASTIDNTSGSGVTVTNNFVFSNQSLYFGGTGNLTFSSGITSVNTTYYNNGAGTLTFASINTDIAGRQIGIRANNATNTGVIAITGDAGANFTGGVDLVNGTLLIGSKAALGSGVINLGSATLSASADLSGANAITNTFTPRADGVSPTFSGSNNITLSGTFNGFRSSTLTNANVNIINNIDAAHTLTMGAVNIDTGTVTNRALSFVNAGNAVFSGVIANGNATFANGLALSGAGTTTLSAANTYSGVTTLSAGQLNINNASALGTGAFSITGTSTKIDNTSGLAITNSQNNAQNWNGDFTFVGSNDLNMGTGPVTMSADRTVTVNAANLTVGGAIGGAFGLTKSGAGSLTLTGNNNYTGITALKNGALIIGDGSTASTTTLAAAINLAATAGNNANLTVKNGATLTNSGNMIIGNVAGTSGTTNSVSLESGSTVFLSSMAFGYVGATTISSSYNVLTNNRGSLTLSGNLNVGLNRNSNNTNQFIQVAGTTQVGGQVSMGSTAGTTNNSVSNLLQIQGGKFTSASTSTTLMQGFGTNILNQLTVSGTGTAIFSNAITMGASSNSGVANLTNQIILGGTGVLEVKALVLSTNGVGTGGTNTISFDGGTLRAGSGASNNFISNGVAAVTLNVGGGTIDSSNNAITIGATIDGSGTLTKTGTGTLTLSGANTYSGGTTVNGGTLIGTNAKAFGTGSLNIASGTLNLGNNVITNTLGTVTGGSITNGTITNNGGSFTFANAGALDISAVLAGSDSLTQSGTGTTTLSGVNTYTGNTYISAGAINLTSANSLLSSGSLNMSGISKTIFGTGSLANRSFANSINVTSGTGLIDNNLGGGTLTLSGAINNSSGATLNLADGIFSVSNNITGSGSLLLTGGSTLNLGAANGISTLSSIALGGSGDTGLQTNTLNMNGYNQSLTGLTTSGGSAYNQVNNSGANAMLTLLGNSSFGGSLNGNLGLTVSGSSTLSGSNAYTGTTTVANNGSLTLGANAYLTATSNVVVQNGASLLLGGTSANQVNTNAHVQLDANSTLSMGGNGSTRATAQTFATLTLTGNSVIDFANLTGISSLTFTTIGTGLDTFTLSINNWSGTSSFGPSSSGDATHLYDSAATTTGLSVTQLGNINFYGTSGQFLGTGGLSGTEIVPVPEPSVMIAAALLLGWLLFINRGVLIALINRRRSA